MKKQKIGLLLGIMCMLLTIGIAIQVKTVKNSSTGVRKNTNRKWVKRQRFTLEREIWGYCEWTNQKRKRIRRFEKSSRKPRYGFCETEWRIARK